MPERFPDLITTGSAPGGCPFLSCGGTSGPAAHPMVLQGTAT